MMHFFFFFVFFSSWSDSAEGMIRERECDRRYNFQSYFAEIESNDVKFLYGVNTETRALIKRSSRAGI